MFSWHGEFLPPIFAKLRTSVASLNWSPERGVGQKRWSAQTRHRRHSKMQSASLLQRYHSSTPPPMQKFLSPLTPPIPISAASSSKNQVTIGNPLDSFPASWLTWSLATPLWLNCWQLSPQFAIFLIFVNDDLSSSGLITNHWWQLCPMFSSPFRPINATWLSFLSSMLYVSMCQCQCCICQVWKTVVANFLSLPSPPPPGIYWTVAATGAADPVYFEAMATKQNRCAETQHPVRCTIFHILKACMEADATSGSFRRWGHRWASAQAGAQRSCHHQAGLCFQTRWFLHLLLHRHCQAMVQELFFWLWTGFLHALDKRRHPCLHCSGTRTVSSHCHTQRLDLWPLLLPADARAGGSPVETGLHPWLMIKPVGNNSLVP